MFARVCLAVAALADGQVLPPQFTDTRMADPAIVALADKLETLVGMFGIGQLPSGDRDPFALRRHALGVIRMLAEQPIGLTLDHAIDLAVTPRQRATLAALVDGL